MIDYKDIGQRIRAVRLSKKMTQEKLAEAVGVGVTHISHIETGNTIPSLQVFIDILNTLNCSADDLLCIEIKQARSHYEDWIGRELSDCSQEEIKLITEVVITLKKSIRRLGFDAGNK